MRLVEEHARRRAPIVLLADRLSGHFVAVVLALAAVTAVVWWPVSPDRAIDSAVALLIVTCPCALALATPLAVTAAIGRAARAGILVKGADALERLARPGLMLFDKTGTLTTGRPIVLSWWGRADIRAAVAALEGRSAHPLARALGAGREPGGTLLHVSGAVEVPGGGVEGDVDGRRVVVGSPRFVAGRGATMTVDALGEMERLAADGHTPVAVAVDGHVAAVAGLGDTLRPGTATVLAAVRAHGWQIGLLSGDHPAAVAAVGRQLGLHPSACRGGVSPEDKLRHVERARALGPVVMVGDGVNDAAALAAATVGVGVHGGAEAVLAAADVFVTRPGLAPVAELLDGARRTLRVIRRNLIFSLGYNAIAVALAMAGRLDPIAAAILMPLSSVTVIVSSFRSGTFPAAAADTRRGRTWR
jgi:Cu2+-exporting ATPase